jgi:molybdenum cofactor guanylyltransferase
MTGVVLCGGQSSRMGQDKGLLLHQSATWAQLAVDKLVQLQLPVVLSINAQQYDVYQKLFQNLMVVMDDSGLQIGGPLRGILSVHTQYPHDDLLILACDMRDMQVDVLAHLRSNFSGNDVEAVVFQNADILEPLCAIYTANGLHKILSLYRHGLLKKFSLQHLLQQLNVTVIPVPEGWEAYFRNFNSASDLRLL